MPRRLTAVVVSAVLLSSACSDGDEGAAPSTTERPTSTTVAPTTTTTPVDPYSLRPPAAATDAAGLAEQLRDAHAVLADPDAGEVEVAGAALAQQLGYRTLGDHPEWDAEVLAALPEALRPTATSHAAIRRELRALGKARTELPEWRIVAPAPLPELQADYEAAGAEFGLEWEYLAAIHLVETGTGRIRGTSVAGAQGPMQFLPATWAAYGGGGDIDDTRDAIFGAARYLAANRGATDMANALWNYNHSDHYVRAVTGYAQLIQADPLALRAFHDWGIWYRLESGDVYLPVGWPDA